MPKDWKLERKMKGLKAAYEKLPSFSTVKKIVQYILAKTP